MKCKSPLSGKSPLSEVLNKDKRAPYFTGEGAERGLRFLDENR